jgi:uncharacterized protein YndB with AHSA1/START domain/DNA-binding transcriptional ArsR family regulator
MQVIACIMCRMRSGMDAVFRALADPTRRRLLDRLHERNGQTLGELGATAGMTRQSVTQHLGLLEAANLVSTTRRGREKLHYLNPVPLHEIQERWIDKFEQPRLRTLSALRRHAEDAMTDPGYVYVTYIRATAERVWEALTDPDLTAAYWGHRNVSADWRAGSRWDHVRADGTGDTDGGGTVEVADPPRRLVLSWEPPAQLPGPTSRVTFDIEPWGDIVRLTVTHTDLTDTQRADVESGWAAVVSNLKSLLETGQALPQAPWEMRQQA